MNVKDIRRDNLRRLAREIGGVNKLADKLDRSQAQISHLIGSKPSKNIGDKLAGHIEQTFNKPLGWLDKEYNNTSLEDATSCLNRISIPLLAWHEIDSWVLQGAKSINAGYGTFFISDSKLSPRSFALAIAKEEANLLFNNNLVSNCVFIIDPTLSIKTDKLVIVKINNTDLPVIKKISVENDLYYLEPLNSSVNEKVKLGNQMKILGVVRSLVCECV